MSDFENHPIGTAGDLAILCADRQRSVARVADITTGIDHAVDPSYWRFKARIRIAALEEDEDIYGLLPHETEELAQLKDLLER